jgi:RNA polymerase sigma-70 factor, ECF subfamily
MCLQVPQGTALTYARLVNAVTEGTLTMSTPDDSILNQNLVAFLGGDQRAGAALYRKMRPSILAVARERAPDLRNDLGDVANEVFILMMEAPQRFDPARGSARAFISTVLIPEAIQRVRAKMARPGTTTRLHREKFKPVSSLSTIPDPLPNADLIPSAGYGSPQAIEAACDAHVIWERATPPMKLILGGLLEGKTQNEIATEAGMDRFRVIRMIAGLQRQFAAAA